MIRNTLLASTLALLLCGGAGMAFAQTAPAPASASSSASAHGATMHRHGVAGHGNMSWRRGDKSRGGVLGDLRALEHLYMQSGRSKELAPLYKEVLSRSQDPRVRDEVYRRLARLQAQPTNVDEAIATLRKGLEESLANEATQLAQREKMRSEWQQKRLVKPVQTAKPVN